MKSSNITLVDEKKTTRPEMKNILDNIDKAKIEEKKMTFKT